MKFTTLRIWMFALASCITLVATPPGSGVAAQEPRPSLIRRNNRFGYVEAAARRVVISPRFEAAKPFSERTAPVRSGGRWGYVNTAGEWVIQPSFEDAEPFSEDRAAVRVEGRWGYIDKSGSLVIPARYEFGKRFSDGLAPVRLDGEWLYLDRAGNTGLRVSSRLEGAEPFSEGVAAVRTGGLWGFMDRTGSFVIAPKYHDAKSFGSGLAPVRVGPLPGGRVGYINHSDHLVIPPTFLWGEPFSEGLAAVQTPRGWGYIDVTGRFVISARFALARPFVNDVALVNEFVFNRPIYLSRTGNLVYEASDRSDDSGFGALSLQPVTLQSQPTGARVYMIPREDLEDDPALPHHPDRLLLYLVPDSTTNLHTKVFERRYIVLFVLGSRSTQVPLDVTAGGTNKAFGDLRNN